MLHIPHNVNQIIGTLEQAGFEAYAVGGCVRDSLLGLAPHDWDICTSALPEEILSAFPGVHALTVGMKHGTITLILDSIPYEVTTFRIDGEYLDSRRPDSVSFVKNLKEDVSRRDFTVNAMAYHPQKGLFDFFGGEEDLKSKRIRCVGEPDQRFLEDALRILRALRFASTYGFTIEDKTEESIRKNRERLQKIAPERIREEFMRLLAGKGAVEILRAYAPVFSVFLPEIAPMVGFHQHNPYHHLDVWEHTLAAVSAMMQDGLLRLVMLLHDIGKPPAYFMDAKGIGHFYGHPQRSAAMADEMLKRLRFDNRTQKTVHELVLFHDAEIPAKAKNVRKWLNRIGEERLRQLILVKRADASGQHPDKREPKLAHYAALENCLNEVLAQGLCYTLRDLQVNGKDLVSIGIPEGQQVGAVLNRLLQMVMDGRVENSRLKLLEAAEKFDT